MAFPSMGPKEEKLLFRRTKIAVRAFRYRRKQRKMHPFRGN